jgi:adenine-specific DNA methylase
LASSRATSYAALIPASKSLEEWEKTRQFIIELSKWENSLNQHIIRKAKEDILKANGKRPPRVLDPFAGGGSIPLEALRLGCEVHAVEYNPVATLILKCTLEYPQKYGRPIKKKVKSNMGLETDEKINPLLEDVKKWGNWVLEEAKKEIGRFYPADEDGSIPVGYYWMRTIPCQNPSCEAKIPLTANWWLAKKSNKNVALYLYVEDKKVKFKIVGDGYEEMPEDFDPSKGTVSRAIAVCPVCGSTVDDKTTRKLFQEGMAGEKMVAVVLHKPGEQGKRYRLATEKDLEVFKEAEKYLEEKRQKLMEEWGIDPVPDEPLKRVPVTFGVINVWVYGMNTWGDLFNSRQKLALITFTEKVRLAYQKMIEGLPASAGQAGGYDEEYAKAVVSYLGLGVNRLATYLANLVRWRGDVLSFERIFDRQALGMVWDYGEVNPFSDARGCWDLEPMLDTISHLSQFPPLELEEER